MMITKTLSEDLISNPGVAHLPSDFMAGLLSLVHSGPICQNLGEEIKHYALQFVQKHSLQHFNRFSEESYIRNYIGQDPATHWEALIMNWKKGNRTAIHSHPQFAGYTFADGKFLVEVFEMDRDQLRLTSQTEITDRQSFYAIGEADKFDNHIHRITCLSETAHSLHIYSDDARKGFKYEATVLS